MAKGSSRGRRGKGKRAKWEEQVRWARGRLEQLLEGVEDPRRPQGVRYPLVTVLLVALMASVCGADDAQAMEHWGEENEWWLERLVPMPHGAPSQDVFLAVFAAMDPEQLQRLLLRWAGWLQKLLKRQQGQFPPRRRRGKLPPIEEGDAGQLALDGKSLRASRKGGERLHMVGAMMAEAGLLLCRYSCEGRGELWGVGQLLKLLDVEGMVVSADAGLCHKELCEQLQQRGARYVLRVKGNQPTLQRELKELFEAAEAAQGQRWPLDGGPPPTLRQVSEEQWDKGHGRLERRKLWLSDALDWVPSLGEFAGARWVAKVQRQRIELKEGKEHPGKVEEAYFIGSGPPPRAEQALRWVRRHWQVENGAHWVLDVAFREDQLAYRSGRVAENMALLRTLALNLLKADRSVKLGVKNKRLRAGWSPPYLLQLLCGPLPQPEELSG